MIALENDLERAKIICNVMVLKNRNFNLKKYFSYRGNAND